jgi:hypothetical protein
VWQVTSPDKTVATSWAREFEDQIILPDGHKLVTLRDAEATPEAREGL